MLAGFTLFFAGVVLMRMRATLATARRGADAPDGARMSQWSFVFAAYAVTLAGAGALALALVSWAAMRKAEK